MMTLADQMAQLGRQAKAAARALARLTAAEKNDCLRAMAAALERNLDGVQDANRRDLEAASRAGLPAPMLERLRLDEKRIGLMAAGLRDVAGLPDPVGRILDRRERPNGLRLEKVATPLGVIVIIYESRPNVTVDAASLCLKSGNACILRGGKEAAHSNAILTRLLVEAGRACLPAFPEHAIQLVATAEREAIRELLALTEYVDLCMPRGGEGLIRAVTACSKVPVIKHYKGVCHVFVDRDADLAMAEEIAFNAKCQRPSVCNAMETLLVDRPIAGTFLPALERRLASKRVELRADPAARECLPAATCPLRDVSDADYSTEYNDYILNLRVVDGVEAAMRHIAQFGSAHSDAIVTRNEATARHFLAEVDSAAVYWNASTRFTDGGEFGMGAEIGISTDKIGARGPMGLEELTTYKWVAYGTGQVRT
jgi:glutamate-5-semialdehyde dehydrogenase